MQKNKDTNLIRNWIKKIVIGAAFIGLAGGVAVGTAHAEHWHHWHHHWHEHEHWNGGYYGAPDYYYAPQPGYYTAPEPYEYYGPEPAPRPSGFGLFFGF